MKNLSTHLETQVVECGPHLLGMKRGKCGGHAVSLGSITIRRSVPWECRLGLFRFASLCFHIFPILSARFVMNWDELRAKQDSQRMATNEPVITAPSGMMWAAFGWTRFVFPKAGGLLGHARPVVAGLIMFEYVWCTIWVLKTFYNILKYIEAIQKNVKTLQNMVCVFYFCFFHLLY